MIETGKIESLDFEGKIFVFDNSIEQFRIGETRYYREEYSSNLSGRGYDAFYGSFDPENSVVKAVLEKGGLVRKTISGKTDYYVIGKKQNDDTKNRDYKIQKEKGKPIVAISTEDILRLLGMNQEEEHEATHTYNFVELYDPDMETTASYAAENIEVEECRIVGAECADWEYTIGGEPVKLYLRDYIGDKEEITIPTYINGQKVHLSPQFPGTISFPKCKAKIIKIPGCFKNIPVGLFEYNDCIEEVILGNGVEEIDTSFCFNASHIKKVCFPDSIKEVGSYVLTGSDWETAQGSEVIAGNVLLHKYEAKRTEGDRTYIVPNGITCIAGSAFFEGEDRDPRYITRIELPPSVQYISDKAFAHTKIKTIKMPSTVHIGRDVFLGAYLRSYYEREQYFVIGDLLYELMPNQSVATIPDGVKKIADYPIPPLLLGRIEELILPDSVEEIGVGSFAGCRNLKTIKFSKNLKKIGDYAFSGCTSLTNISLPESVEIGEKAFD